MVLEHLNCYKILVGLLQGGREARKLCLDHLKVNFFLVVTELLVPIIIIILVKAGHFRNLKCNQVIGVECFAEAYHGIGMFALFSNHCLRLFLRFS